MGKQQRSQGREWFNKQSPIVLVSGPRLWSLGMAPISAALNGLFRGHATLRQGGAQGVDNFAKTYAAIAGWQVEPDWKPRYNQDIPNKVAPLRRTENMLDGVNGPEGGMWSPVPADVLVVFRQGPELPHGGTGHAVREARKRHIPIVVFEYPEEERGDEE